MKDSIVREDRYANYLLVEGDEDKYLFSQLLSYHQIYAQFEAKSEIFDIKPKGGIRDLLNTLKTELKVSGPSRFGIVIDADTDLNARWQSLQGKLLDAGYARLPRTPQSDGTVIQQDGKPVVGIWLMPNNNAHGTMEDFAGFLVPPNDLLWPIAGDVVQRVIERDRRFRENYRSKACIHTWLAWQKEPGTPLRLAITERYLDASALYAQRFIAWLRKLFDLEVY